MKTLIVGLGSIGRRHLRNLRTLDPDGEVLLLRSGRATLPEADLIGLPVVSDLARALAWQPQAVIVATPTALHLESAIPAARQGCALLLEKPVSHSLARVDELQTAVAHGGGPVLVGFQFRFHAGLTQVAAWLAAGAIGRPLSARAVYAEWLPGMHPWEDYRSSYSARADLGGGVVLTLCHPLDTLRWLLGEVAGLWAYAGRLSDLEIDVVDSAEIGLRFERPAFGSVHLDFTRRPPQHCLEISGTEGVIRWEMASVWPEIYRAAVGQWEPAPAAATPYERPYERNEMYLAEMAHFLALAAGRAASRCTLEDGVRALELALAVTTSAQAAVEVQWGR